MKIKEEPSPYYLIDFCRKKNCQQIKVEGTNDNEIKSFLIEIFKNKRIKGNAKREDGTILKLRRITPKTTLSERLLAMPLYNISPSQARIYTKKSIENYSIDKQNK